MKRGSECGVKSSAARRRRRKPASHAPANQYQRRSGMAGCVNLRRKAAAAMANVASASMAAYPGVISASGVAYPGNQASRNNVSLGEKIENHGFSWRHQLAAVAVCGNGCQPAAISSGVNGGRRLGGVSCFRGIENGGVLAAGAGGIAGVAYRQSAASKLAERGACDIGVIGATLAAAWRRAKAGGGGAGAWLRQ